MHVVGIDLSGPSNAQDTSLVCFREQAGRLACLGGLSGAGDCGILERVSSLLDGDPVIVGLDAPLSYRDGGGDRPADSDLRRAITDVGLPPGSVMAPTMPRMVYLTLRGLAVARGLETLNRQGNLRIVEVHPTASLALRGAPLPAVRRLKADAEARRQLLAWLAEQGLDGVSLQGPASDHDVAASAAALAAWAWHRRQAVWLAPAQPPLHPYDFAC